MDARLNLFENTVRSKSANHINSSGRVLSESTLPMATQELVKLRASQINGCAMCTDMHTKEAALAGESQLRLNLVAAWREATVFTEAERAALEWPRGHPDRRLRPAGSPMRSGRRRPSTTTWKQLGVLVALIALINTYNRLNVMVRQPAGDYQPGQWD